MMRCIAETADRLSSVLQTSPNMFFSWHSRVLRCCVVCVVSLKCRDDGTALQTLNRKQAALLNCLLACFFMSCSLVSCSPEVGSRKWHVCSQLTVAAY